MKELCEDEVLEAIYNNAPIDKIYSPEIRDSYNSIADLLDIEKMPEKPIFSNDWLMPDDYKNLDLVAYFSSKISTEAEAKRVSEELTLFLQTDNENLLRYLIYLSDVIKQNNIVIGVGRGSSVSLYLLYLCGLHHVDCIRYGLSYADFFKIKNS